MSANFVFYLSVHYAVYGIVWTLYAVYGYHAVPYAVYVAAYAVYGCTKNDKISVKCPPILSFIFIP